VRKKNSISILSSTAAAASSPYLRGGESCSLFVKSYFGVKTSSLGLKSCSVTAPKTPLPVSMVIKSGANPKERYFHFVSASRLLTERKRSDFFFEENIFYTEWT
jgi:hypothetical protein